MTRHDEVLRERFLELDDTGHSAPEIASRLGVSARTIARWRGAAGRAQGLGRHPAPAEVRERARVLLNDGCSYAEAGRTLGVADLTIRRWFPGRGWTQSEGGRFGVLQRQAARDVG